MTAYHEAGHAVCAAGSAGSYPVTKISIIPRGMTGGVTRFVPPEDRISISRSELLAQITTAYGGIAVEEEMVGDITTGGANDIARASELARRMVTEFGMSDRLGAIHYGGDRPNPFGMGPAVRDISIADDTARDIDSEVRRILNESREQAKAIVREHRELIERMAVVLLELEVLEGEQLRSFLAEVRVRSPRADFWVAATA